MRTSWWNMGTVYSTSPAPHKDGDLKLATRNSRPVHGCLGRIGESAAVVVVSRSVC